MELRTTPLYVLAEKWCARYGPIFRIKLGARTIVAIGDCSAIEEILRDRPDRFGREPELAPVGRMFGVVGVFVAEGQQWRHQRRLVLAPLNAHHLHHNYGVIARAAGRLHARLIEAARSPVTVPLIDELRAYTSDVTLSLAFGDEPGEGAALRQEIATHLCVVRTAIERRLTSPLPRHRRMPADAAEERSAVALSRMVDSLLEQKSERLRDHRKLSEEPESFLQALLAAEGEHSMRELRGNLLTLLVAGDGPSAHTLAWTAWMLARQPDVQARMAEEARSVLTAEVGALDYASVSRLQYVDAVLREAIRLRPPGVTAEARSLRDSRILGVHVPAGTRLLLLTRYASLTRDGIAPGPPWPTTLVPDRWLPGPTNEQRLHRDLFFAFGAGPRFCPGRNLAFMMLRTALAVLALGFELSLDAETPEVDERVAFMDAPDELLVRIRERSHLMG